MKNIILLSVFLLLLGNLIAQNSSPFQNAADKAAQLSELFGGQWNSTNKEVIWSSKDLITDRPCATKPIRNLQYRTATMEYIIIIFKTTTSSIHSFASIARYARPLGSNQNSWYLDTFNKFMEVNTNEGGPIIYDDRTTFPNYSILKIDDFHYVQSSNTHSIRESDSEIVRLFLRNFNGFSSRFEYMAEDRTERLNVQNEFEVLVLNQNLSIDHSTPKVMLTSTSGEEVFDESNQKTTFEPSKNKKVYTIDKYGDFTLVK